MNKPREEKKCSVCGKMALKLWVCKCGHKFTDTEIRFMREEEKESWSERFDEEFGDKYFDIGEPDEDNLDAGSEKVFYSKLKEFISSALQAQRADIVDKIKDACIDFCFVGDGVSDTEQESIDMAEYIIKHTGLSEVKKVISD